jgi:homoserine O-acetyltransferase
MSKNVITTAPDELIGSAAKKMEEHSISALPVVDENNHLIGLITSDAISMLIGRMGS